LIRFDLIWFGDYGVQLFQVHVEQMIAILSIWPPVEHLSGECDDILFTDLMKRRLLITISHFENLKQNLLNMLSSLENDTNSTSILSTIYSHTLKNFVEKVMDYFSFNFELLSKKEFNQFDLCDILL
jgi:hypothetical protein